MSVARRRLVRCRVSVAGLERVFTGILLGSNRFLLLFVLPDL